MSIRLTERQQHILWATVNHYIATAEPVGSKALAAEYELSISPATIRNVMGVLGKTGLLYQPHTSAGRVPSDSGYRIYVDELITPSQSLVLQIEQLLTERLRPDRSNIDALLREAAQILATLSGCVALITMPQSPTTTIRHLHLMQVDPQQIMLILVTDTYETQSVLMELPHPPETEVDPDLLERELHILSNFLNHQLQGRSLNELANLDWQELDREFQRYVDCLTTLLSDLKRHSQSCDPNAILVGGLAEVLRQPEFSELQQAQSLIHLLEDKEQLWPLMGAWSERSPQSLLSQVPEGKRVTIQIGAENPLESIQACTLVSSTYQRGNTPVGNVGVLGPTRMAYEKVIVMVEATADYLSSCLNQIAL